MKYKDDFGDRMKEYESVTDIRLTKRTPVILRLDMCHGHTFTKKFLKPFDMLFVDTMQKTMLQLCKEIDTCVFGYTQSDEISLVLCDYKTIETMAWFDNRLEKLCSVVASKATRIFNKEFCQNVDRLSKEGEGAFLDMVKSIEIYVNQLFEAEFDCRAFNIPKDEVCNAILWRQKDADRNSVNALAQSLYSHKKLQGIPRSELKIKMKEEKNVDWDLMPNFLKWGSACKRFKYGWYIDYNMPILKDDREYVEGEIFFNETSV